MSMLLLAAALLVLPSAEARRRLAGPRRPGRWKSLRPGRVPAIVVGIVLGLPAGVGGAIAGALLAATVWRTYRETIRQRDRLAATKDYQGVTRSFTNDAQNNMAHSLTLVAFTPGTKDYKAVGTFPRAST